MARRFICIIFERKDQLFTMQEKQCWMLLGYFWGRVRARRKEQTSERLVSGLTIFLLAQ